MYDFTYFVFIVPALIFAMYAQSKVNNSFNIYGKIPSKKGYTASQVAIQLLHLAGIEDVQVEYVRGKLTDHYDPRKKVLRLSENVYNSSSIAAIGVAAHETGHAIQHHQNYSPLMFRNAIVPLVSISSSLATPLIYLGIMFLFLSGGQGLLGYNMMKMGAMLFGAVVLFHLITLPVELNASKRAVTMLQDNHFLTSEEIVPCKSVLNSAALTYVASAAMSIATLARILFILSGSRRRD